MEFSKFGKRYTRPTGARELMDDLGEALANPSGVSMLGGGNPAHIPELEALIRRRIEALLDQPDGLARLVGNYSEPRGESRFRGALAEFLNGQYGWSLDADNIALTAGSQNGFFLLFNLLAGQFSDGSYGRILFPLTPEYAGYTDLGLEAEIFTARKPVIEELGDQLFKYHVDFDALDIDDSIRAICVSRPTNPTGNVLSDAEMERLAGVAEDHGVPLIVDNAYGLPFPNMVYTDEATPTWNENTILCMTLSKIGLPAVRTGIVVANKDIVDALTSMNAVVNLSVSSVGPVIMEDMVRSGEVVSIGRDIIRPFYQARAERAMSWVHEALSGCDYRVHRPEGSMFLWLWLPGLPISTGELYRRLKARNVLVIDGEHFFPGIEDTDWRHRRECIRINFSQEADSVQRGLGIIGEEIRRAAG